MNLISSIEWVASNLRRQWASRDPEPDFGDMGTAFGLDMSLSCLRDDSDDRDSAPGLSEAAYAAGLAMR